MQTKVKASQRIIEMRTKKIFVQITKTALTLQRKPTGTVFKGSFSLT
jgi:hypothetical protein